MSDKPKFVHLHCHSDYSYLDAVITLQQYAKYAETNKVAITEHGNLCSAGQMIASHNNNFILGLQTYYVNSYSDEDKSNRYHMLLLAKNKKGWDSLIKINNTACDNFYSKPIISIDDLKRLATDLVVTSACQGNRIAELILKDEIAIARKLSSEYKQVFKDFYLELQYGTSDKRQKINEYLIKFSKQLDIPLIVTNDVHLFKPEDQLSKQIMNFVNFGKKQANDYSNLWLCPQEQLLSRVPDNQKKIVEQAMQNTVKIAYQVIDQNLIGSIDTSIKLPDVNTDGMITQAVNKLKSLNLSKKDFDKYLQRLKYQVKVISDVGGMGYFKVVSDAVKLAWDNNIFVNYGRGCFLPGNKIKTENEYKNIENIEINDLILTHTGKYQKVINKYKYKCNQKVLNIKTNNNNINGITKDHKVYAVKKINYIKNNKTPQWYKADQLLPGDYIVKF